MLAQIGDKLVKVIDNKFFDLETGKEIKKKEPEPVEEPEETIDTEETDKEEKKKKKKK